MAAEDVVGLGVVVDACVGEVRHPRRRRFLNLRLFFPLRRGGRVFFSLRRFLLPLRILISLAIVEFIVTLHAVVDPVAVLVLPPLHSRQVKHPDFPVCHCGEYLPV